MAQSDLERLKREYELRDLAPEHATQQWSASSPAVAYLIERRVADIGRCIANSGVDPARARVLDVGCGSAGDLARFEPMGFKANRLIGIDYLAWRCRMAVEAHPELLIAQADGAQLPFADAAFDVVSQFTAFSAIVDPDLKRAMAAEMWRVLKPGGLFIWYDMRTLGAWPARVGRALHFVQRNRVPPRQLLAKLSAKLAAKRPGGVRAGESSRPTTVGPIDAPELKALFPQANLEIQTTGLYFALLEESLRLGRGLVERLERIEPLRTHLFATATKQP